MRSASADEADSVHRGIRSDQAKRSSFVRFALCAANGAAFAVHRGFVRFANCAAFAIHRGCVRFANCAAFAVHRSFVRFANCAAFAIHRGCVRFANCAAFAIHRGCVRFANCAAFAIHRGCVRFANCAAFAVHRSFVRFANGAAFALLLVFGGWGFGGGAPESLVHGRLDVYQHPRETLRRRAIESTLTTMSRMAVDESDPEDIRIDHARVGSPLGLCSSEPEDADLIAGGCTATLIDDDLVLTAGQCISEATCAEIRFVFKYQRASRSTMAPIRQDDVFRCEQVVVHRGSKGRQRARYAIVRLDRPATPRFKPVPLRLTDISLARGQNVAVIGNTAGRPTRIDSLARVYRRKTGRHFFRLSTQACGQAGSAVYETDSYSLAGILIGGGRSYKNVTSECAPVNRCPVQGAMCCLHSDAIYLPHVVADYCASYASERMCGSPPSQVASRAATEPTEGDETQEIKQLKDQVRQLQAEQESEGPAPFQPKNLALNTESRYDFATGDTNRLQGALRVIFVLNTVGGVELVGLVSSGNKYNSRWSTLHTFNDDDRSLGLNVRRLYLRRAFEHFRLELGSVPPVKGRVSSTGLNPAGWIDGGRVVADYGSGQLEVAAGSFRDFRTPNFFNRAAGLAFNYLEVELSQRVFKFLSVEASGEYIEQTPYLRGELRLDLEPLLGHNVELVLEGLVRTDNGAVVYGPTLAIDLLGLWSPTLDDYLTFKTFYSVVDDDIGNRGIQTEDFFSTGRTVTLWLKGKIHRGFKWNVRAVAGDFTRLTVALTFKFDPLVNN